jgi:hypothetical protein
MRKKDLQAHQGSANGKVYLPDIDAYKNHFILRHNEIPSWRKVAKEYGLHPNMARMIANGYDPGRKIRKVLGLPPRQEVDPCPKCGSVHTTKRCTSGNHKPRSPRIAISKVDAKRAAQSIMNNLDEETINELIEILKGGGNE